MTSCRCFHFHSWMTFLQNMTAKDGSSLWRCPHVRDVSQLAWKMAETVWQYVLWFISSKNISESDPNNTALCTFIVTVMVWTPLFSWIKKIFKMLYLILIVIVIVIMWTAIQATLGYSMCQNWIGTHQKKLSLDASLTDVFCWDRLSEIGATKHFGWGLWDNWLELPNNISHHSMAGFPLAYKYRLGRSCTTKN